MYLKSIELYGFKSFAHKVVFEFHNGITGIVGPNGSGKSNVSDAVRWVLGEQSARQLRGASMQDVIFAGTENRKPLSYAYVALNLDNSDHVLPVDYDEVTIARRVYRSGESEYLLNGNPCRLKDVNELFYDTGIGKEGYSIIGQGQIERIISGKPEEKRELFDEAVGIVKYKKRKDATVKKLNSERDNLVRVNDILAEQERRIGPLEKQAQNAREYVKLRERLKEIDVNSFLIEVGSMQKNLVVAKDARATAENNLASERKTQEDIIARYDAVEQEIAELETKINNLKDEQNNTTLIKGRLENEILILEEQIRSAKTSTENLEARIAEIEADKATKTESKLAYEAEKDSLSKLLEEASGRLDATKNQYAELQEAIKNANDTIEKNNASIMDLLEKRGQIKSKEQRTETMLEQTNISKAKLTQRILERKTLEESLNVAVSEAEAEFKRASENLANLKDKEKEINDKIAGWKEKASSANNEYNLKKNEAVALSSKLESLKNIAERYDGYGNSIRSVMEKKKSDKGILGVVSDIIQVEKKYEIAIETALGGNIQNIVTEDEACAKRMINFLKENRLGRATFLPLTSVDGRGNFKKTDVLNDKGVVGLASELVSCDSKFDGVCAYLLGRVVVCDDIDNALALAKRNNYSLHIVTLDGEYLSPGGSMAGGRFKNNSNLLSRNREIEELESKISEINDAAEKAKARITEVETAIILLESDKEEMAVTVSEAAIALNTAKLNYDRANEQKSDSMNAFEGLSKESDDIENAIASINAERKEIEIEKQKSEDDEKALRKEIEDMNSILDEKTYMETTVSLTLSQIGIEEAEARQKVDFAIENLNRVISEIEKCDEDIKNIKESAASSLDETAEKEKKIASIKETIAASSESFAANETAIREAVERKDELNKSYKGFFNERQAITERIAALDKEVFRLDAQIEKITNGINYQTNYMWEEYELTYHNAEELKNPDMNDVDELKREAAGIRDSIRRMGNVNVGAIEEYAELSERYNFLKSQHDDLVEAEKALMKLIEELDNGMRVQFEEGFKQIQVEFDKSFKELFGGGKGTLELVEGEDVLETGIRIIAQPPGKKLVNMMQMSGGEKSLTAIALLFAIQNMKPSPFCLLDEIEAALDDANVDRFAKYLNKLTKNTQFIIITHRRGTMNAADRLYGITMQEKGVSALVSVNLIDAQLDD